MKNQDPEILNVLRGAALCAERDGAGISPRPDEYYRKIAVALARQIIAERGKIKKEKIYETYR